MFIDVKGFYAEGVTRDYGEKGINLFDKEGNLCVSMPSDFFIEMVRDYVYKKYGERAPLN